jgi:hypothetical protein
MGYDEIDIDPTWQNLPKDRIRTEPIHGLYKYE